MQPTISGCRLSRTLADSMTAALACSSTLTEDALPVVDGNVGSSPNTGRSNVPEPRCNDRNLRMTGPMTTAADRPSSLHT
jgi:hypothetical protein